MMGILLAGLLTVGVLSSPKEVVISYLKNLPLCLKTGMNIFVSELVDEKVARRLQIWLDAWRSSGYSSSARLLNLEFKEVKIENGSAVVVTAERWEYSYTYIDTGEVALPPQRIFYEVSYRLRREGEGWKIQEIEILKEVKEDGCGSDCGR